MLAITDVEILLKKPNWGQLNSTIIWIPDVLVKKIFGL